MDPRPCKFGVGGSLLEGTFLRFADDVLKDENGKWFQKTFALVETSHDGKIWRVEPEDIRFTGK